VTVVAPGNSPADSTAMARALALAAEAGAAGDVPVGAVVTDASGVIIAEGRNERELTGDPTAHAEVLALRRAAEAAGSWNLEGHSLVVTLEPCLMCAGALLQARISRVVFGSWDDKAGAAGSVYDVVRDRRLPYRAEVVGGVAAEESAELLGSFFETRRMSGSR
jgi:tRNA(adenine34) deaminase